MDKPTHYEEANTEHEFEVDWDAVYGMDQWVESLSEGKLEPPMKKRMARSKTFDVIEYNGGMNNYADARDIENNELANLNL